MRLAEFYGGIELCREEKIVYARLMTPHRVLSTCRSSAGGLHDDLMYIFNHQSCEPAGGHMNARIYRLAVDSPDEYKREVADRHSLPFSKCATLGTAANMNNATICHERFCDLEVVAVCTGGVEGNAGRAGDPATYYEPQDDRAVKEHECDLRPGTINAMIFINRELTPGAMVTAVITATEAKSAALQELEVPSRYSEGIATGTGTDQIAVASKLGGKAISFAGKHSKVGELIGRTMHDAVLGALALQNGLTPAGQCSSLSHLERFRIDGQQMCQGIAKLLSRDNADLFEKSFSNIIKDPLTVAAVAALVHLRDKFVWGVLPKSCIPEVMALYGAQISAAVSGKSHRICDYMNALSSSQMSLDKNAFLEFVYQAFALGFQEKWSD
ncbi:MAG: Adenosylcobinamide amidohydrolase [Methanosaeta sp. PtaB.Bin018]|nr:adenosylcobinamide amidohydrolase [Methanothrix sp.]OPX74233.1 MAG: Adenosylcobinamide amidohydrolase [Methanosaeta sp. PtaB.Bin018]OPY48024.1 MAG: Adenosylcobinamide amidohydrolase [Methanosaeta sp. PtaU1.Bin016]